MSDHSQARPGVATAPPPPARPAAVPASQPDAYERLVDASPQASLYCRRFWLEAVAPGRHEILTLARGGELAAAWPVVFEGPERRRIEMPRLTQKLGILFRPTEAGGAEALSRQHRLMGQLIARLPAVDSFYHRFHEGFTNWLPFYWRGFTQTTRYTYLLDLGDEARMWRALRSATRRAVRRAQRSGIRVTDDLSIDAFLPLHQSTYTRQGLSSPLPEDLIRRVDAALAARGQRRILAARDASGRLRAGLFLAWDAGTAYYLMAGSDPEMRENGGAKLLLWEALRFAAGVARRFDFEGSMMQRVESVFRGFGAVQTPYFVIERRPDARPDAGA